MSVAEIIIIVTWPILFGAVLGLWCVNGLNKELIKHLRGKNNPPEISWRDVRGSHSTLPSK